MKTVYLRDDRYSFLIDEDLGTFQLFRDGKPDHSLSESEKMRLLLKEYINAYDYAFGD